MKVRSVDVRRVWDCMLCVCDSEEREHGVGAGVNATMLSETLSSFVYYESLKRELKTKTVYGCRCDERLKN